MKRRITIVGGGLAGLSLGIALLRRNVEVILHEAGTYPRHRVCGEFICGVKPETLKVLGIESHLCDAIRCRSTAWFDRAGLIYEKTLPVSARGISRYTLDERLVCDFVRLGGRFYNRSRVSQVKNNEEGFIWSTGRTPDKKSEWVGLSMHSCDYILKHDLEMHLGRNAYVGVARIEKERVNICGLFKRCTLPKVKRNNILLTYLKLCGLNCLHDRLLKSKLDFESIVGINQLNFSNLPDSDSRFCLGDSSSMIPPFTGNGMSMALESAELALDPLIRYSRGELDWQMAAETFKNLRDKTFRRRLDLARFMHPFFYARIPQYFLIKAVRFNCLPFNSFFRVMH